MIKKVHLIFKTHLDIGFTDFAGEVVRRYFDEFIPAAIILAEQTRQAGSERFIWTTGSWLIYEYLEQASEKDKKRLEAAIAAGDIAWHALPFTTHTELLDASLFELGLSLSLELDKRYGNQTIAAKLTDVPGHTRAIVPHLAKAGVKLLHIGVNPASAVPEVPTVFRWQSPTGEEIIVIYQGEYGSTLTLPGVEHALAFAHSNDNLGPPTIADVHTAYDRLHMEFPNANVVASTLDEFVREILPLKDSFPVFTSEIGDTWIHGAGSDPLKVAQFRAMLRMRRDWLERSVYSGKERRFKDFSRKLLMIAEHTWGLDIKTHLADITHFNAVDFQTARSQDKFKKVEDSWREKCAYLSEAVDALRNPVLRNEINEQLLVLKPTPPDTSGWARFSITDVLHQRKDFQVKFDPATGSLSHLEWKHFPDARFDPIVPNGLITYQTFSQSDYDRFRKQYIRQSPDVMRWAKADFEKPGIEHSNAITRTWLPELRDAYKKENRLLLFLTFPEEASWDFGAPRLLTLEWFFYPESSRAELTLQWFDKPACRLPEALWFSFASLALKPVCCTVEKLGASINIQDVVSRGARNLHAIGKSLRMQNVTTRLEIESLDAPLVAVGKPKLLDFDDQLPNPEDGIHFNLFNNIWGTNFPMWFGEDMKFRFAISFSPI